MTEQRRAQLGRQTTILCTIVLLAVVLTQPGCQRRAAEERRIEAEWDSLMADMRTPFTWHSLPATEEPYYSPTAITEFNPSGGLRSRRVLTADDPVLDLDTAAARLYRAEREFLRARDARDLARQEWDHSYNAAYRPTPTTRP